MESNHMTNTRNEPLNLYNWQEECISSWESNNHHGIADVVTGAGKTVMAIAAALKLCDKVGDLRVKIVVPNVVLAKQWRDTIKSITGEAVGLYYGQVKDKRDLIFKVYVINSARYSISRHIIDDQTNGRHVLLIADECHHYASEENSKIFSFMWHKEFDYKRFSSLGLSATPECKNFENILVKALGDKIYSYTYKRAVMDKIISPFFIYQINISFLPEELLIYSDLSEKITKCYGALLTEHPDLKKCRNEAHFFELIAKYESEDGEDSPAHLYSTLIKKRRLLCYDAKPKYDCLREILTRKKDEDKIIIFCERIFQNDNILEYIRQNDLGTAVRYHSNMTEEGKRYSLSQFREGLADILVTCKALDEGMDVPEANIAVVFSGTLGIRQKVQRLGRILRKSHLKKYAVLYYLYMGQTSEEGNYIAGKADESQLLDLKYNPIENQFYFEKYEDYLWEELKKYKGTPKEKEIREMAKADVLSLYMS